ncbi:MULTISPECIES: inositol monophosphatase family protein [Croceimicrobium]|uniref:Inositol-1-monophosphatase n=1 Tax=Croceimicrobium hydrocarbonivorans TaxID=2761580 RepID=A0A7H0VDR4_9FLAO|nr:inositol monophosphatase family protein [Croceimicrobium hydrocarbonivorans]QNR23862.1 inositol monophosphatase [Croceimicrobium hydrocarbonivorans]
MNPNWKQLLQEAADLCRETGQFIASQRRQVSGNQVEVKSLNSLVSYVDQEAERRLVEGLSKIYPEAGFITEEETVAQERKEWNWIIDPLDGTTNFLFDLPIFAVSVALYQGDRPQLGIVYEVGQDEMFTAAAGLGAWCNDRPIKVSDESEFSKTLLATGFPYYDFDRLEPFNKLLAHCYTHTRGVRRLGSAATDLAYVAAGRFNGYFEYGLSPWDVAAGILLVQEAGGKVTNFSAGPDAVFSGEIVASADAIFNEFQGLVAEYMLP